MREGTSRVYKATVFKNKVTAKVVVNHFILEVESTLPED